MNLNSFKLRIVQRLVEHGLGLSQIHEIVQKHVRISFVNSLQRNQANALIQNKFTLLFPIVKSNLINSYYILLINILDLFYICFLRFWLLHDLNCLFFLLLIALILKFLLLLLFHYWYLRLGVLLSYNTINLLFNTVVQISCVL